MSKVRKNSAILKRAITERRTRWSGRDWNSEPKSHWRCSPVEGAGQSSRDEWQSSKPQGKWKEISTEIDALGSALKEKSDTWTKSCRESTERESELHMMVELAAIDERHEDKESNIIKKTLKTTV